MCSVLLFVCIDGDTNNVVVVVLEEPELGVRLSRADYPRHSIATRKQHVRRVVWPASVGNKQGYIGEDSSGCDYVFELAKVELGHGEVHVGARCRVDGLCPHVAHCQGTQTTRTVSRNASVLGQVLELEGAVRRNVSVVLDTVDTVKIEVVSRYPSDGLGKHRTKRVGKAGSVELLLLGAVG